MAEFDDRSYRRRVFFNYLTHPLTLVPLVLGATGLMAGWAVDVRGLLFGGVVAGLVGAGTFLTRLLSPSEATEQKVLDKIQREQRVARERELKLLEARLVRDQDPRTEQALRDLRLLTELFQKDRDWSLGIDAASEFDILSGVDRLFQHSEASLVKSLNLLDQARKASPELRRSLLRKRDLLVREVDEGVQRLRNLLEELGALGLASEAGAELRSIREELDSSLEIAKRTNQKMASWDEPDEADLSEWEP